MNSFPLFIVGMPRSGTKLLRGMLNQHFEIAIPLNETEFLPAWIRRWASYGDLSNRHTFMQFYQQFHDTFYFQNRLREHGQSIKADVWYMRCDGDFSIANVFEQLIRHDANLPEGGIWGDKSPSYVRHISLIRSIFPTARFIHLVRDARDYALSLESAFGKNRLRAAQRWNDSVLLAQEEGTKLGDHFCMVRYEDLIDHPEEQARKLCSFLNVEFQKEMLTLSRPTENLGDTRGETDIVSGNHGKYQTLMTSEEVASIEAYCAEGLQQLDYSVSHQGPNKRLSTVEMRKYQVSDALRLIQKDALEIGWTSAIQSRVGHFIKVMW